MAKIQTSIHTQISQLRILSFLSHFILFSISFFLLLPEKTFNQTFAVHGNVHTSSVPVQFASVTLTEDDDTSKKITALTDIAGNYQLYINTNVSSRLSIVPNSIKLEQNYPNPFSSSTEISYTLNKQSDVAIVIYDILGREVRRFTVNLQTAGMHGVQWDGKNNFGVRIAAGVYFYRLRSEKEIQIKKMIYTGGVSSINIPLFNSNYSIVGYLKKDAESQIAPRKYSIHILNTDSTRPLIDCAEFSNVLYQKDTTLNFTVHDFDLSLCYDRQDSILQPNGEYYLRWQIYLNNITGTNQKNFTNWTYDCYEPIWSPNGRYIAYWRKNQSQIRHLYVYDILKDSSIGLLTSDTSETQPVLWTPDSKSIIYEYGSHTTSHVGTCIIDVDGKNNHELKYAVSYLYPDGYNTLFTVQSSTKGPSVYHSNLDGTINEFIIDLGQFVSTTTGGVTIFDFNPTTNDLLLSFDDPSTALPNYIAKFNITQNRLDTVVISALGWKYYKPKFSSDYNKIALTEVCLADDTTFGNTNRVSIFESDTMSSLVEFREKYGFLDMNPFAFSRDDKYFAFVKDVSQPAFLISWINYLYIIELATKHMTYIDNGVKPIWNPSLSH